jgi:vacuolar iron transporter family protein
MDNLPSSRYIQKTLTENWRREMEAALLYEEAARAEPAGRRRDVLAKLAQVEYDHAQLWAEKLTELGVSTDDLQRPRVDISGMDAHLLLARIEEVEHGNAAWYESLKNVLDDEEYQRIIERIDADEAAHASLDEALQPNEKTAKKRLKSMWHNERWHRHQTGGWVGDAIYGVNDGLGAIFGIIAGVAGYTANDQTILISGFFGALASTLSMGAGAWLATKSENELMESEITQERKEIDEDPEHEIEELALLYELKGLTADEAARVAHQVAQDPDEFLKTMAAEELGIHETSTGNPWKSAWFGSASTFVGAIVPLIPFFFMHGITAMITAAVVSIVAHFVVGAAKSVMTTRSWWASGLEMTFVGILVGVVSYALGEVGSLIIR